MTEQAEAALRYAKKGWQVFPVWPVRDGACTCGTRCGKNAGKHPLGDIVHRGVYDATTDQVLIRKWWGQYPDANVGVATGARSGIFVVDEDPHAGGDESMIVLTQKYGPFPETLRSQTGHGGTHYVFKYPGKHVKNLVSNPSLGVGIDVRGDAGYIVAPPSSLGEGQDYRWLEGADAPSEASEWIVQKVTGPLAHHDPLDVTSALNGVSEGQRDITMFRLACKFRAAGVPPEMTEELLVNAARKCSPPFDESTVREKVMRAYRQYSKDYPNTDSGNADRMIDRHGANLRFSEDGRWLSWNGMRWNGDHDSVAINLAIETTQSIIAQAMEEPADTEEQRERRDLSVRHAYTSQNVYRLQAMVSLARSDPAMFVPVADLDRDPMALNMVNGTVDLRSGTLRAHDRADFITKVGSVAYLRGTRRERWLQFLERFLPDREVREFVQRAAGYSATGSVGEQCLFFLYGSGRNGKSTLVSVLQTLLGQYGRTGSPDLLLSQRGDSHPTVLADLVGSRFVPTIEAEEGKRVAEAQTKWLTGGDRLKARRMGKDYFEFEPSFKIWLVANHRPIIYGTDMAIWRRIYMVPFTVQLPESEKVLGYDKLLVQEEGPGILEWVVEGATQWYRYGLQVPTAVRAAVQEYRDEMNVIGQFMTECVVVDEAAQMLANDMYTAFLGWARLNGETVSTQRRFSNKVFELGYRRERGANNKYYWLGLRLSDVGREYSVLGYDGRAEPGGLDLMNGASPWAARETGVGNG